jgi:hypothetical protein
LDNCKDLNCIRCNDTYYTLILKKIKDYPWQLTKEEYKYIPKLNNYILPGNIHINLHGGFTFRPFNINNINIVNFVRCYGNYYIF